MSTKVGTAILEIRTDVSGMSAGLAAARRETDAFQSKIGSLAGLGAKLGSAFALTGVVTAVVSLGKALAEDADNLLKLSDRTGLSTDALQRMRVAGDDAGNTVDDMAAAISKMQVKLAGGDNTAEGALRKLNISLDDFKSMSPERQFYAVSDAIQGIPDPAMQARLAIDIFGKSGAEILPVLKRGFDDVRDSAVGMSADTIAALDDAGDTISRWATSGKAAVAEWMVESARNIQSIGIPALRRYQDAARDAAKVEQQIAEMTKKLSGPKQFATDLPTQFVASEAALKSFDREFDETIKKQKESAAATKKLGDELKAYRGVVSDVVMASQGYEAVLDTIDGNTLEGVKHYRDLGVELDRIGTMYGLSRVQLESVTDSEQADAAALQHQADAMREVTTQMALRLKLLPKGAGEVLPEGPARQLFDPAALAGLNKLKPSTLFGSFGKDAAAFFSSGDFGKTITGALMGGGGLKGGLEASGSQLGGMFTSKLGASITKNIGGTLGSTLGSIVGPLGALAGPLLDKAFSAIANHFKSAESKINPLRQQFVDAAGGLDKLNERAHAAGLTLDALLGAKNQKQYEAAVKTLTQAFERADQISKGVDDLAAAIGAAGATMPDDFQATIDQLISMNGLTDDERAKLSALKDAGQIDFKALEQSADGYGVSLDSLGHKFNQDKLNDSAGKLGKFFEDAKKEGADLGGVLAGLQDEAQGAVTAALKNGLTLPTSLKEVAEYFFNTGQLVDENGQKLTDFTRLSFADTPLDKSTSAIVTAIDKLRELFEKMPGVAQTAASGIAGALDGIPDKTVHVNVEKSGDLWDTSGLTGADVIPMAAGGAGRAIGPTLFYSAGNEDFAFSGEGRGFTPRGGDSASVEAAVNRLGKQWAQHATYVRTQQSTDFARASRDEFMKLPTGRR